MGINVSEERFTMKKLNITKEQFNRSNYFQKKYGKLEYVSESGKLFKTNKGKVLRFAKESTFNDGIANDEEYTFLRISVAWDVEGDEPPEGLPTSVYIKVPSYIYEGDGEMNLSGMIEDYFGYRVDDVYPSEVNDRDKKRVKDWLLWTDDEGLVEDDGLGMRYDEGFMSNMGKDGQHLYSIIYKFDGWDGSVQEYGKTEEDAIQNAIAKGKIDDEDEIVKIVDLGEKGEYLESSRKLVKEWTSPGRGLQKDDFDVSALEDVLSELENNSWRWSKWDNGLGGFYLQLKEGLKKPGMFSGKTAKENWKKVEKDEEEIRKNTYEAVGEFCKSEIGEDAFPNIDSFMDCPKKWREYPGSDWGTYLVIYRSDGGRAGLLSDKGDTDEDLSLSRYLPIMANGMKESKKLAKEAGRKVIPAANGCSIHDMYDCWIVTNKDGLNIGQCKTLIEAKHIAENADEYTAKKLGCAESKKLVKEYDDGPDPSEFLHKNYYDTEFEEGDKVVLTR